MANRMNSTPEPIGFGFGLGKPVTMEPCEIFTSVIVSTTYLEKDNVQPTKNDIIIFKYTFFSSSTYTYAFSRHLRLERTIKTNNRGLQYFDTIPIPHSTNDDSENGDKRIFR